MDWIETLSSKIADKVWGWIPERLEMMSTKFWADLDAFALVAVMCCLFLYMMSVARAGKWAWTIMAVYVLANIVRVAR